jgi:hypothetical protein
MRDEVEPFRTACICSFSRGNRALRASGRSNSFGAGARTGLRLRAEAPPRGSDRRGSPRSPRTSAVSLHIRAGARDRTARCTITSCCSAASRCRIAVDLGSAAWPPSPSPGQPGRCSARRPTRRHVPGREGTMHLPDPGQAGQAFGKIGKHRAKPRHHPRPGARCPRLRAAAAARRARRPAAVRHRTGRPPAKARIEDAGPRLTGRDCQASKQSRARQRESEAGTAPVRMRTNRP